MDNSNQKASKDMDNLDKKTRKESWEAWSPPPPNKPRGAMKLFSNFYFRFFTTILFLVLLSYLITFRLVVTIIAIGVLTPQIPMRYYNIVIDIAHQSGVFVDYGQAKRFVFRFTWGSIFLYLLLNGMGGA